MLPPELPPVRNKVLYAYRVFAKWFSFFVFGLGAVIITISIFPVMRLVLHPKARFQKYGRRFITLVFRFFVWMMHILGIVNLEPVSQQENGTPVDNREQYRRLGSKIVVANHPSLLDPVMMISLIPNADSITTVWLKRNILTGVASQLYILGSRELDDVLASCTESLKQGNCLFIFPEGTRTRRSEKMILKKGAARIALASGCGIIPVHIGGTDKFGLGKKDPWTGFNPTEKYIYRLTMGQEIDPQKYQHLPAPAAAKLITKEIEAAIFQVKTT